MNDFKIPFFRLSKPCGTGPRPPKRTGSPGTRAGLGVSEMLETAAPTAWITKLTRKKRRYSFPLRIAQN